MLARFAYMCASCARATTASHMQRKRRQRPTSSLPSKRAALHCKEKTDMSAPFGWTVIRRDSAPCGFITYKRDCPADTEHFAADLAPFTHKTRVEAQEAGKRGQFAY